MFVSDFERSMLEMMAEGYSDKAIARHHHVGRRTMERQLADLMARLGIDSQIALGAIAARERWIDVPNPQPLKVGQEVGSGDSVRRMSY